MAEPKMHSDIVLRVLQDLARLSGKKHQKVVLDGGSLKIHEVVAVARYYDAFDWKSQTVIELEPAKYSKLERSVNSLNAMLENGLVVYGVNTGFGGSADTRNDNTQGLQRSLIEMLHYGTLSPGPRDPERRVPNLSLHQFDLSSEEDSETLHLPKTWTRAAILVRLNSLLKGYSAVRAQTVDRIQDLLTRDIIPIVPLRGSISASGDLLPLSYVAGAVQGKSSIRIHSRSGPLYADEAFDNLGLDPVELDAKEGLAIVNGTSVSSAAAALVLHDTHLLAVLSQIITGMSVEALCGSEESFDPFLSACRPHPGQIDAARNIRSFLRGSKLTGDKDVSGHQLRQDRYSIRTAPQWIGPAFEDLLLAHTQIEIELNSATDNPLIDSVGGRVIHGGNFQAKAVTSAMEKARQAIQTFGRMQFAQCTEIINPATNFGLPPNLVAEDPSTSYIFKGTDICMASLQSELGFLANPVNHVMTAEMGNQSLNSLALISTRYTHMSNDILFQMGAAHLVALCQALDLRAMEFQFFKRFQHPFNTVLQVSQKRGDIVDHGWELRYLSLKLWKEIRGSFSATVALDTDERFDRISNALRNTMLDETVYPLLKDPIAFAGRLSAAISALLKESWCRFREVYMREGVASPLLGRAAKRMYENIRRDLGVPFLCESTLTSVSLESKSGIQNGNGPVKEHCAPTLGSYNSLVYRALKDGSFAHVATEILEEAKKRGEDDT